MALKKSDLYSSLWESCDELRGGMDPSQYKDYVLFMLFIKYVSDKYANTTDFTPALIIPEGSSFKDMVNLKNKPNIGVKINNQIIKKIVDSNERLALSDFPNFNDPVKLGEGNSMVSTISNLISIFENPELDFSSNRAEHDDILGDAYEYLMRHFASASGKSKGQFYTPAEVSRIIAKVIGITSDNARASTTVYDPTCGSGSLLLKVAAEAEKKITLEGQEKDITTAGLARMNMILHDFPTCDIRQGNTLSNPKFMIGNKLKTYDYVVANPPFSDKVWSKDIIPTNDAFNRFSWGVPPKKQGDYAYLLHIISSVNKTGKGACILPHGVLFRSSAEAVIRKELIKSGILKGIIGLPVNLFYGTGISACILILDKENASKRKEIFMIDASKDFIKDGAKNRLREQDIHKIVNTFLKSIDISNYSRTMQIKEIEDGKNNYNLNLSRYIDNSEIEDIQDIDGHLNGGIPEQDIDDLKKYWKIIPGVRQILFESAGRKGYLKLKPKISEIKSIIHSHEEFIKFNETVKKVFENWKNNNENILKNFKRDEKPKKLINLISEDLLESFKSVPLINSYNIYQCLMDYWSKIMQDDCYLISSIDWSEACLPIEVKKIKSKGDSNKLVWPKEPYDYLVGKKRFKSNLIPGSILIDQYFKNEKNNILDLETKLIEIDQQLKDTMEENSGEDGLLIDVIEGEGEKQKITEKSIKAHLKDIEEDEDYLEEIKILKEYLELLNKQKKLKSYLKTLKKSLDIKIKDKYFLLKKEEIKFLVINRKWMVSLLKNFQLEFEKVSNNLIYRIELLAERYSTTLPELEKKSLELSKNVKKYLKKMGFK